MLCAAKQGRGSQGYVFHGGSDGSPLLDGLVGRATSSDGASTSAPSTAVGQVPRDRDAPAGKPLSSDTAAFLAFFLNPVRSKLK